MSLGPKAIKTGEQKFRCMGISFELLVLYRGVYEGFLERMITGEETWRQRLIA